MFDRARPVYTIGTAAEILSVHPRTLRLYEDAGLIRPARKNNRRFYSPLDLEWISYVRYLIHEKGLNQEGLRRILALNPCWEMRGCPPETMATCRAVTNGVTRPRLDNSIAVSNTSSPSDPWAVSATIIGVPALSAGP